MRIIDTRKGDGYETEYIPEAIHLPWGDVIDPTSHRFKPPAELQRMFEDVGLSPDNEVIVYCQGGIRAAHTVLALKLAGFPVVRNHEGSWSVWSRSDVPKALSAQR